MVELFILYNICWRSYILLRVKLLTYNHNLMLVHKTKENKRFESTINNTHPLFKRRKIEGKIKS